MKLFQALGANVMAGILAAAHVAAGGVRQRAGDRERGDVPGWVLITLMTAGLVTILWALAADQLAALFTKAMTSVTGP